MTIRHDARSDEAEVRQEARNKRTSQQQLKVLDDKLGKGVGAKKERTRLLKLIEKGK